MLLLLDRYISRFHRIRYIPRENLPSSLRCPYHDMHQAEMLHLPMTFLRDNMASNQAAPVHSWSLYRCNYRQWGPIFRWCSLACFRILRQSHSRRTWWCGLRSYNHSLLQARYTFSFPRFWLRLNRPNGRQWNLQCKDKRGNHNGSCTRGRSYPVPE